jgi:sugar phosphate isomerase/epimerase
VIEPHVNVPFEDLDKYLHFIKEERLNLEIYFGSRVFDELKKEDIINLKDKLDYNPELSLHAPYMDLSPGAVDPKVREVTFKRFSDVLDFAEILRPKVVVFHSGYDKWKYDGRVDIWLEGSLRTWIPLNKKAEALGVKIAIENIFEDEPTNLKLLMEEVGSKNFGICFDTGHFNLFSKLLLTDWLEKIDPYIIEVHLHDNLKTRDLHLAIGEGNFNFRTLFKELQGKDVVYTIEAHTVEGVRKSLERFKTYLR